MRCTYTTARITADRIDQAYSLVSLVAGAPNLEAWRTFCWNVIQTPNERPDRDNIIVEKNPLDLIQGLCIARAREHDVYGRLLDAPIFVVASAADSAGVAADFAKLSEKPGPCRGLRRPAHLDLGRG